MDKVKNYWVEKAHRYAEQHPSIVSLNNPSSPKKGQYTFTATFNVNLPGTYDLKGITPEGVQKEEPVDFEFSDNFPYRAPKIYLRDNFPRNFPHINPSQKRVIPCVYDGNLSELLQQPKWFDAILDQITDWLEQAAAGSLINPSQGWEPMRSDNFDGFVNYDLNYLYNEVEKSDSGWVGTARFYSLPNIYGYQIYNNENLKDNETLFLILSSKLGFIVDKYIPNYFSTFGELCTYARDCYINNFRDQVDKNIKQYNLYEKKLIFITLAVRRPFHLIGSDQSIEFLNYAIKLKFSKKQRVHLKSSIYYLRHLERCNPELLRKFSGVDIKNKYNIVQVGCGSLGSKICLHLTRNGYTNFHLVDNGLFLPHNNARHALVGDWYPRFKTEILKDTLVRLGARVNSTSVDVLTPINKIKEKSIFIDSSASISLRNQLSKSKINGYVIHTALYNHGKLSLFLCEGTDRNPRIDDLIVALYTACLYNNKLRSQFLTEQSILVSTGQGCGSYTTIASDSRISLSSASLASKIQLCLNENRDESGEILIGKINDFDMAISWQNLKSEKIIVVPLKKEDDLEIRVFNNVFTEMEAAANQHSPDETGGVLIGHISLINNTITITELIPAPEDSICTPTYFELGIKGLKNKVLNIERNTNGLLTYVGTWHSHLNGGSASNTDKTTKERIIFLRDYEPTVCLILSQGRVFRV